MAGFRDLIVYQKAYANAMEIFEMSKSFPKEEKYSLTDQPRRASRSVCSNLAEAYRKRRYENHFVSKLTDSDAENTEAIVWNNFAFDCKYTTEEWHVTMHSKLEEVGRMIGNMIDYPNKFRSDVLRKLNK